MSYLNALRLHFAGQFQSNVSTVNNDPAHFDNAIFKSSYQDLSEMADPNLPANGWFNPQGDAAFRLLGCTVTSAWMPSGQVAAPDPVLGYIVADSDGSVPAKLVDLDPEQQLVSQIWGLEVRIADSAGNTLLSGQYDPAAFTDIWQRATGTGGGDNSASAMYQSVLRDLQWGDVSASPFLTALQQASASGLLSIKFNVDGMNLTFTSPDFMCGRITGTIGPADAGEPRFLTLGRQFMAAPAPSQGFFIPAGGLNFCAGVVDANAGSIYLDLGNAISTSEAGGPLDDLGDLTLSVFDPVATPGNPAGTMVALGTVPASVYAQDGGWYARTAGVVALPLTTAQLAMIASAPLAITGNTGITINEAPSGAFVRADDFVYRMSPGDVVDIPIFATSWGQPLAGQSVSFVFDPSQLQSQMGPDAWPYIAASPDVASPTGALTFGPTATTDAGGVATLTVTAADPGTPRWFNNGADYGIDGQVYGIRPSFADPALNDAPVNESNFISFLLWSGFTAADPPTWTDVQPIFQQYANLYPVMLRFLNMADLASVQAHAHLLLKAFSLAPSDPNSMPVTRDLSPAKRAAIIAWLNNPLPGPVRAATRTPDAAIATATAAAPVRSAPPKGGKAAAMARRLVLQSR